MAGVGDVYRSKSVTALSVQIGEQVLFWQAVAKAGTGATDQNIADAIDAFMGPLLKPMITANATYRGTEVQRVTPIPIPVRRIAIGQQGACGSGGNELPLQSSGLISWRTDQAGRSHRGRTYIPFPTAAQITAAGLPAASYLTLLTGMIGALLTPFVAGTGGNTNNFTLVIWSRKLLVATPVTSGIAVNAFATQRRRGTLGRPNPVPF